MEIITSKTYIGLIAFTGSWWSTRLVAAAIEKRLPDVRVTAEVNVGDEIAFHSFSVDQYRKSLDVIFTHEDVEKLKSVEILIGDPRLCLNTALKLDNLKWFQGIFAGVEGTAREVHRAKKLEPNFIFTRNGGVFIDAVAQYVLGQILAHERLFFKFHVNQRELTWEKYMIPRTMKSLTIGIVGVGFIGKEVARLSKSFNMTVWGLVRSLPAPDKHSIHVDHYRVTSDLPELLSSSDYICSVLPSTSETDNLFDGDVLSNCKQKKAVFINVGRANVVKDATIIHALNEGWISHAILDVFEKEPLPTDSELWTRQDVTITPHISHGLIDLNQFVEDFATNYEHYKKGEPMNYVVDWSKGY